MRKFKVLEHNEKFITCLGIRSYCFTEPTNEFFKSISSYYILWILITSVISSLVFTCLHWPQIEMITSSTMVLVGCYQASGMFMSFGLNMKKVKAVHLQLQEIINSLGNSSELWIYE